MNSKILRIAIAPAAALLCLAPLVAQTFTTGDAAATIPDNSMGTFTACQNVVVSGVGASLTDANVLVTAAHSWVGDVTLRLQSPGGASTLMLLNRPGRTGTGFGSDDNFVNTEVIEYDDAHPTSAENMGVGCAANIGTGAGNCDNFFQPAPAATDTPIAGLGTNLAQFNGSDANGTWTLCAADSAGGDTGTLTSWSLVVSAVPVELMSFSVE